MKKKNNIKLLVLNFTPDGCRESCSIYYSTYAMVECSSDVMKIIDIKLKNIQREIIKMYNDIMENDNLYKYVDLDNKPDDYDTIQENEILEFNKKENTITVYEYETVV